jgi:hypothetical protein
MRDRSDIVVRAGPSELRAPSVTDECGYWSNDTSVIAHVTNPQAD